MKDSILNDENIYDAESDQIQDNQNSDSDQQKLKQSESDSEDYFADHVDILNLKIKICQSCQQSFASDNLLHKHLQKKNCSKKLISRICQFSEDHQSNKDHLTS